MWALKAKTKIPNLTAAEDRLVVARVEVGEEKSVMGSNVQTSSSKSHEGVMYNRATIVKPIPCCLFASC